MKIKLHFNRVNMQRKKANVWTAHTSRKCEQSQVIVVRHRGVEVLRTVFDPDAQQPRAYLAIQGSIKRNGRNLYIDIDRNLADEHMAEIFRED